MFNKQRGGARVALDSRCQVADNWIVVEHANIIASVGQPKLIENVARSVGNDNNGLHTEPFLGRVSMLCFLYGPGEPGRYPA